MAVQFCSQCGTPTRAGDRFCRTCGESLVEVTLDLPQGLAQPGTEPMPPYAAGMAAERQPLVQFDVEYPGRLSRLLNGFFFIKWLLAIPHLVVLYLYGAAVSVVLFISWIAIIITGRYPRAMFDFVVGYFRWSANVSAYISLMRDEYPPFTSAAGMYPVQLWLAYPSRLSRLLNGFFFIKWLLLIPHLIVLSVLILAAMVCGFVAWIAIIFNGRYPEGIFRFLVGIGRWSMRVNTYYYFMTDRYPPFTTAALSD